MWKRATDLYSRDQVKSAPTDAILYRLVLSLRTYTGDVLPFVSIEVHSCVVDRTCRHYTTLVVDCRRTIEAHVWYTSSVLY